MQKTLQKITPFLWFDREAEEAAQSYVSIFKDSRITSISRYGAEGPGPEGTAMVVEFEIEGQDFKAINGTVPAAEGLAKIALYVDCETQAEVDRLWDALLAGGGKEVQCGWLTDRYGVSWNIVPPGLSDYLGGDDPEGSRRAMREMLSQVKLDINAIRRAYEGT
jgi:predicted 3-demethylubiquinone-9 3-methyltransferase (glyoxalase superfamily)